ncbi:MAG: hypothetical protein JW768_12900 [Chitinispirillaceae bacterium]|nr:hypothetical protein [Chitinispirillaceae bacterium]
MNTHTYNKDLDPRLFGREATGTARAPADATRTQQKPAQEPAPAQKKAEPEFRITLVEIVVPADGLKKDLPFDISGTIQPLVATLTRKKVRLVLITRYKGSEDQIGITEADIDTGKNTFAGNCKQLFYHDGYQKDKEKPADAKFTLEARASGTGAEKEATSKPIELPMATSTTVLKKGKYDDAWCAKNQATHPKSGKEYVPDNKVKKLQENMFKFRLLKQEQITGLFDEATEAAVKKFQELAKKPERKKASDIRIIKADKITFDGTVDGIAGEKTEKEIAHWLQNNWVKPDPEFRKGDIDDNGVRNKHGERGGEKHHPGSGILDLQKQLAAVGAYTGKLDGWFGDLMEAALKLFQDKASKGELVEKDGKKAKVSDGEKLKGHRNGVGDGPTVEAVKKEAEKGRKVEGELITLEMLKMANSEKSDDYYQSILANLNKYAKIYEINTPERIAHFLSQIGHESGFEATEENLNYSENRMKQIFGCKEDGWDGSDCPSEKRKRLKLWENPSNYARKPENLANYVYADRLGNGNEKSGDGYKYRGRGMIQLTGKDNYKKYTEIHNKKNPEDQKNFVENPDLICSELEYGVESAFVWWSMNNVNSLCNGSSEKDIEIVSKKVNGGTIGLEERKKIFQKLYKTLRGTK